jgi:hypothetical protein
MSFLEKYKNCDGRHINCIGSIRYFYMEAPPTERNSFRVSLKNENYFTHSVISSKCSFRNPFHMEMLWKERCFVSSRTENCSK